MRLQSLLALTAASALLLPLAAHAEWPAGKKGAYMEQCVRWRRLKVSMRKRRTSTASAALMRSRRTSPRRKSKTRTARTVSTPS